MSAGRRVALPIALLRALVGVLALTLATAGALPTWALLAGIEGVHVCHCSLEHHDCVCAKCNPEHDAPATTETLTTRCGDDDVIFTGKAIAAVLASPVFAAPPAVATRASLAAADPHGSIAVPPPTPPPRSRPIRTI